MEYLSPGVYVEEVPSAVQAIAGVSTSIPGFIGIVPDRVNSPFNVVTDEQIGTGDGTRIVFDLDQSPVVTDADPFEIRVNGSPVTATLSNTDGVSQVTFDAADTPASGDVITGDYRPFFLPINVGEARLCTNFSQFKDFFGNFSTDQNHNYFVHAVYGFFNNGGSSCYAIRITDPGTELAGALNAFAAIDPISLVAMPGQTTGSTPDAPNDLILTYSPSKLSL